jgi:adhesin transport system membrane fusion protein
VNIPKWLATAAPVALRTLEWLRVRIEKIIAPIFPAPEPVPQEGTVPFSTTLDEMVEGSSRRALMHKSRIMIRTILIIVVVAIIWSALTRVDEITRADAKVIPTRQLQVVQSSDGGIVSEILVREGQTVEKGQFLLKLDQTRVASNVKESKAQTFSLRAKAARLRALAEGNNFIPPEAIEPDEKRVVQEEQRLFEDRRSELSALIGITRQQVAQRQQELVEMQARRTQAQRSLELSAKELEVTKPLLKSGAVSEVDILRLEREVARFRGEQDQAGAQIARVQAAILEAQRKTQEAELNFKNETRKELAETMSKLNSMTEGEVALTDRVDKSLVRSPVNGIVQRLLINTVGGVAVPAKDLIEIVPVDEALVLEARVPHKDIAFLRPGQRAVVKFTAYDFSIYGGLDAVVNNISPDALTTEDGIAYYLVRVQTNKTQLGMNLPIIPGMRATVDIISGQKSILSYLMKPVLRAKAYAFSER